MCNLSPLQATQLFFFFCVRVEIPATRALASSLQYSTLISLFLFSLYCAVRRVPVEYISLNWSFPPYLHLSLSSVIIIIIIADAVLRHRGKPRLLHHWDTSRQPLRRCSRRREASRQLARQRLPLHQRGRTAGAAAAANRGRYAGTHAAGDVCPATQDTNREQCQQRQWRRGGGCATGQST